MFILEFDWKEIYTIWEIFKLFFSTRVDEMKFVSFVNFKKLISRYICASFRGTKDLNKGATNWIKDYQENGIKNSRNSLFRRKWRDFQISKGRETKFLSQFSRRFSENCQWPVFPAFVLPFRTKREIRSIFQNRFFPCSNRSTSSSSASSSRVRLSKPVQRSRFLFSRRLSDISTRKNIK